MCLCSDTGCKLGCCFGYIYQNVQWDSVWHAILRMVMSIWAHIKRCLAWTKQPNNLVVEQSEIDKQEMMIQPFPKHPCKMKPEPQCPGLSRWPAGSTTLVTLWKYPIFIQREPPSLGFGGTESHTPFFPDRQFSSITSLLSSSLVFCAYRLGDGCLVS